MDVVVATVSFLDRAWSKLASDTEESGPGSTSASSRGRSPAPSSATVHGMPGTSNLSPSLRPLFHVAQTNRGALRVGIGGHRALPMVAPHLQEPPRQLKAWMPRPPSNVGFGAASKSGQSKYADVGRRFGHARVFGAPHNHRRPVTVVLRFPGRRKVMPIVECTTPKFPDR